MKYLFVIAMEKEAKSIIGHYNLEKIDNNYFKKDNIELLITDISRNMVTKSLVDLIYKYNIKTSEYIMINVGLAGSNNLPIGSVVMINNSYSNHFDLTMFDYPLYHGPNSPFKLDLLKNELNVSCYSADCFVTKTDIKEDAVFDMELNAIINFTFKKYYSIKIVSDSLNNHEYDDFDYDNKMKDTFILSDKILQDK